MEVIVNIIPMHADVHELWMKNMLSVDVEVSRCLQRLLERRRELMEIV